MDFVFKKKLGALGTAAFLSAGILAGCGGSETETEETETEETEEMETEETEMEEAETE